MKLIYCMSCGDIIKLKLREYSYCNCRRSFGKYIDYIRVVISNNSIPLGIDNYTFDSALINRKSVIKTDFWGFVFPFECDGIQYIDSIEEYEKTKEANTDATKETVDELRIRYMQKFSNRIKPV